MVFLTIGFTLVLCIILILVYYLSNYVSNLDVGEKMTPFECGFDPLSKMRSPFSTRFFLLVVLFLIFDVEIALLFPILSILSSGLNFIVVSALLVFLAILLFGMFHEWNEGALDWFSK